MLNKIRIGEIVSVHGVKGALKVLPLTDNPIRFCSLTEVELVPKRKDSRGADDIYEITGEDRKKIWIPAIADVIKAVNVEKSEITVSLLPGLKEVYEDNGEEESGEE